MLAMCPPLVILLAAGDVLGSLSQECAKKGESNLEFRRKFVSATTIAEIQGLRSMATKDCPYYFGNSKTKTERRKLLTALVASLEADPRVVAECKFIEGAILPEKTEHKLVE